MHPYTYTRMHSYTHTHTHTHTHTCIHTHHTVPRTHTHTHTYIHTPGGLKNGGGHGTRKSLASGGTNQNAEARTNQMVLLLVPEPIKKHTSFGVRSVLGAWSYRYGTTAVSAYHSSPNLPAYTHTHTHTAIQSI